MHKEGIPCKPILDMMNSIRYDIANFLTSVLNLVSEKFS